MEGTGSTAARQNIARNAGLLPIRLEPRSLDSPSDRYLVKTNNYALGGALLRRRPQLLKQVWGHTNANDCCSGGLAVARLATPLSVVNRHPCSQVVIGRIMRDVVGEDAALWLRRVVKHYVNSRHDPVPEPFEWATEHIARVRDVFHDALRR